MHIVPPLYFCLCRIELLDISEFEHHKEPFVGHILATVLLKKESESTQTFKPEKIFCAAMRLLDSFIIF